jgi:hypothetical protein
VGATSTPVENSFFRADAAVLWIRVRIKLKGRIRIRTSINRDKLDPDPDSHQCDKLDPGPDTHQFADDKPNCMENDLI